MICTFGAGKPAIYINYENFIKFISTDPLQRIFKYVRKGSSISSAPGWACMDDGKKKADGFMCLQHFSDFLYYPSAPGAWL